MMEDVKQYLHNGTSKSPFGIETDCLPFELEKHSYFKFLRFIQYLLF